jgi:hypothetical protein
MRLQAQINQIIRGKVSDKETQSPLPSATLILLSESKVQTGILSDEKGNFRFQPNPVG